MPWTPLTGPEKPMLKAMLNKQRDVYVWKLQGLSDDNLRTPVTPTGTNLLGVLKHLACVEYGWFCETFAYQHEPLPPFDEDDPDVDLRIEPHETTDDIFAFYGRARAASDQVIDEVELDTVGTAWTGAAVSLRWVILHMLEETARHAGHADINRELLDGTTGYLPPRDEAPLGFDLQPFGERTPGGDRPGVAFTRMFNAPAEQVWEALTDAAQLAAWLAPADLEPSEGAALSIALPGWPVEGTISTVDPHRELGYHWRTADAEPSHVHFTLQSAGMHTRMVLDHQGLDQHDAVAYLAGWHVYLTRLLAHLEQRRIPTSGELYLLYREVYTSRLAGDAG